MVTSGENLGVIRRFSLQSCTKGKLSGNNMSGSLTQQIYKGDASYGYVEMKGETIINWERLCNLYVQC